MGRLDKRTARNEDDRSARKAAERGRVSREQQLREAEAAAERTAAQETLVDEVYALVEEFLSLMEDLDYPGLQTITLPMTRWWWPFRIATRKAVWHICGSTEKRPYSDNYDGSYVATITLRVYLVAESGELVFYHTWESDESRHGKLTTVRPWSNDRTGGVKKGLKELIRQYSR